MVSMTLILNNKISRQKGLTLEIKDEQNVMERLNKLSVVRQMHSLILDRAIGTTTITGRLQSVPMEK